MLSKITNIPGTVVGVTFIPIDNGEFITGLSKTVIQHRSIAETAKDPLSQQRADKVAIDGEKNMLLIDQHGEKVGTIVITIMVISRDERTLNKICRKTESAIATIKCKSRIRKNWKYEILMQLMKLRELLDLKNQKNADVYEKRMLDLISGR